PPAGLQPWQPYGREAGGGTDPEQEKAWHTESAAPTVRGSAQRGYEAWNPETRTWEPWGNPPTVNTQTGVYERRPDGTYNRVIDPPKPGLTLHQLGDGTWVWADPQTG